MSLPWFRMYAEFATDPKIQTLAFEDQRHFIVLLCLKCNGTLDTPTGSQNFRERMIAHGLGLSEEKGGEAKARLLDAGLIDTNWQPLAWDERQLLSDSGRERQRKWRERHRNVTVTAQDKDQEEDKEKNSGGPKGRHPRADDFLADTSRLTQAQRLVVQRSKT